MQWMYIIIFAVKRRIAPLCEVVRYVKMYYKKNVKTKKACESVKNGGLI